MVVGPDISGGRTHRRRAHQTLYERHRPRRRRGAYSRSSAAPTHPQAGRPHTLPRHPAREGRGPLGRAVDLLARNGLSGRNLSHRGRGQVSMTAAAERWGPIRSCLFKTSSPERCPPAWSLGTTPRWRSWTSSPAPESVLTTELSSVALRSKPAFLSKGSITQGLLSYSATSISKTVLPIVKLGQASPPG